MVRSVQLICRAASLTLISVLFATTPPAFVSEIYFLFFRKISAPSNFFPKHSEISDSFGKNLTLSENKQIFVTFLSKKKALSGLFGKSSRKFPIHSEILFPKIFPDTSFLYLKAGPAAAAPAKIQKSKSQALQSCSLPGSDPPRVYAPQNHGTNTQRNPMLVYVLDGASLRATANTPAIAPLFQLPPRRTAPADDRPPLRTSTPFFFQIYPCLVRISDLRN